MTYSHRAYLDQIQPCRPRCMDQLVGSFSLSGLREAEEEMKIYLTRLKSWENLDGDYRRLVGVWGIDLVDQTLQLLQWLEQNQAFRHCGDKLVFHSIYDAAERYLHQHHTKELPGGPDNRLD